MSSVRRPAHIAVAFRAASQPWVWAGPPQRSVGIRSRLGEFSMKKLISLALISTVLALPAAASAAGQLPGPFKNKGQCQSAYNAFLVDARKDAHQTDGISP